MKSTTGFLTEFFKRLNSGNLTYCVLRNYDELPEHVGHDVDMWVDNDQEGNFRDILLSTAHDLGWELVRYAPWLGGNGQGRYFFILTDDQVHVIHIDCFVELHWKGINYIDKRLLARSLTLHQKGFYVPGPGVEAGMLILKCMLTEGNIKEKNKAKISHGLKDDEQSFIEALTRIFNFDIIMKVKILVEQGNWSDLEKMGRLFRWKLLRSGLSNEPIFQIKQWLLYLHSRGKEHLLADFGIFIVFIGPDGSGKTTTAKALLETEVIRALFQIKSYLHERFSYLPRLRTIVNFLARKDSENSGGPDEVVFSPEEFGFFRATMYPLYYCLDYLLGHFFIRRIKAYYSIAVSDRYFHDYFIQKRYSRCPRWLLFFLTKIIPKPDILIYLDHQPELIRARKKDLPVVEISRQVRECQKMIQDSPNGFMVDTSNNTEKVVKEIQNIILDMVRKKWWRSSEYTLLVGSNK
ncbi:hypothetical protein ACFL27_08615 [candidate division CSSED10-310 bacterium]|uniref:Thymidylate kinase-like domain-containing protein n=1 Tax=candidate division CSSED10-310 bacterium TaxID=2855610 RepID=A0ABV6YVL9_UNCC1